MRLIAASTYYGPVKKSLSHSAYAIPLKTSSLYRNKKVHIAMITMNKTQTSRYRIKDRKCKPDIHQHFPNGLGGGQLQIPG
jgi:hypothetical protein